MILLNVRARTVILKINVRNVLQITECTMVLVIHLYIVIRNQVIALKMVYVNLVFPKVNLHVGAMMDTLEFHVTVARITLMEIVILIVVVSANKVTQSLQIFNVTLEPV